MSNLTIIWGISQHCSSRVAGPASITGGLTPSIRNAHVCLSRPRSTSPTPVNSDPLPPPLYPLQTPLFIFALPQTQTCKMHHLASSSSSPSFSPSLCHFSPFLRPLPTGSDAILQLLCAITGSRVGSPRRAGASPQKAQLESNRRGKKRKGRLGQ